MPFMRYSLRQVQMALFAIPLAFNAPTEGFPWDDLRKIFNGGQRMVKLHSGEEILPRSLTP